MHGNMYLIIMKFLKLKVQVENQAMQVKTCVKFMNTSSQSQSILIYNSLFNDNVTEFYKVFYNKHI